ncbi:MAG: GNAT family N-acetyltransferase [Bacteroidota bacterium]
MLDTNFHPFPVLTTDRLVLRAIETTDDNDIFLHRADEKVNKYLEGFSHATIEQSQALISRIQNEIINGKSIFWVINQKGNNKFIGTICLWNISVDENKAEAGYTLNPQFHKMGYMNEALIKVIDFGFNKMKLKTIDAFTHKDNESSTKLLLRNKFKQATPAKPVEGDEVYFSLSKEE